jgi:hypothetical protein
LVRFCAEPEGCAAALADPDAAGLAAALADAAGFAAEADPAGAAAPPDEPHAARNAPTKMSPSQRTTGFMDRLLSGNAANLSLHLERAS